MSYRAIVVETLSSSFEEGINKLKVSAVARKPLRKNQVRIAIRAASMNFFDLLQMVGKYQMKPPLPFAPGSEGAGDVIEIGPGVTKFKLGDRVMCGMIVGTLAEEVVLAENQLVKVPSTINYAEAASFPVGYQTAYHGLVTRGETKKGDYVLVTGAAGGMGIAAIQLAKSLGAIVIACASTEEKLQLCKNAGADHVINYTTDKLKPAVAKMTRGHFCDVVYEVVGGDIFHQCVRCMAGMGRLLVVGFAGGEIPKLPINLALVKGFSLVGVRSGAEFMLNPAVLRETNNALISLAEQDLLHPLIIDQVDFDLKEVQRLYKLLANRGARGKLVINIRKPAKI
eukprot:TRINITY_DN7282_c0_g1_i1.p1 TRINITY_DN7282_c0_g1~~TRINITY_DN7282_c0_g1_i1.p1  ORF type:complete len:340 (+),score=79.37 TRINITY_DN7282_c0_g1_i1:1841-2860(+)